MSKTQNRFLIGVALAIMILPGCSSNNMEEESGANKKTLSATATSLRTAADSGEWSRFRGPTGMGTSDANELPLEWSLEENILWKQALSGAGASSPIVWGEHIYLTSYTGFFVPGESGGKQTDLKRHLIAINRADGKILWDKAVAARLPEEESIRDHGFAASTPVADAEHVYVFFGKTGVIAFDHDGNQKWQADVGEKTHGWGSSASPVIHNKMLIINASVESESLIALDRQTGDQLWQAKGIKEAWNTPLVITAPAGRQEVIIATAGTVYAFDPATGAALWSCKTDIGWYMVPSVVAHDGIISCLGGRSGIASLAIRAGGSGDVTQTHRLWTSKKGSNVSSPVYSDGYLYWMNDHLGIAYCAKAESGEIVYEQRIDQAEQIYASALLAAGRLYYLDRAGRTFVLNAQPQFEQLAMNRLRDGGVFNASPVVDGQRLLIRSDKFLYCVGD
jgi:outer membrane protein assembly factor BamB